MQNVFAQADKDSSGKLSVNEFIIAMSELAQSEDEREMAKNEGFIEMMMASVDGDGNKTITLEELSKVTMS